jgi:hypothetical protein
VADAIEIAGVEQCHSCIQRGMDGGDALVAVGRSVEIGHTHAAKAYRRGAGACGAEGAVFHGASPVVIDGEAYAPIAIV